MKSLKEHMDIKNLKNNEQSSIKKFMLESVFDENIKLIDL